MKADSPSPLAVSSAVADRTLPLLWTAAARNGRSYRQELHRLVTRRLPLLPALLGVSVGLSASGFAFTITESSTAPTLNLLTSQLDDASGSQDGARNFTDNGGPPGQTFSLSTPGSFQMTAFTLQGRGDAGGGALATNWSIQLGTVDPLTGAITPLGTETSLVSLAGNAGFVTFTLDTPLTITSGVQYAFSVYSSVGWYGFAHSGSDVYTDGFAFNHNTSTNNPGGNTGGGRRTFNGFAAPDPGGYDYIFAVQGFALGAAKIWSGEVGGAPNGNWNTTAATFSGASYNNGDSPTFGDFAANGTTPVATRNITIQAGGVSPTSVTVSNSNGDYVFDGAILNAPLTKTGTSNLTLTGAGDNTGLRVNANEGTLFLSKASSATVHAVQSLTVAAGATVTMGGSGGDQIADTGSVNLNGILDLNGKSEGFDTLNGATGIVTNDGGGAVVLTLGTGGGSGSYAGIIVDNSNSTAGTVALVKRGAGSSVLNGANTYSGGTTIQGGTLSLGADYGQSDAASLGSGPVVVTGNGQLRFGGVGGALHEYTFSNPITLNDGTLFANDGLHHVIGPLTIGSGGGVLGAQWGGKDLSIEGGLSGSGALRIIQQAASGGAVLLATDNRGTYSGPITIQNPGILRTVVTGALGTGAVTVEGTLDLLNHNQTISSLAGAGTIAVGNATLTVPTGTFGGKVTGTGTGTLLIAGGTLVLTGDAAINAPTITIQQGSALDVRNLNAGGLTLGAQNLSGTGTVQGALLTGPGSSLSPGIGMINLTGRIGTLNVGTVTIPSSLTISSATTLNYVLGTPGTTSPGNASLIHVHGDLTLPDSGVNLHLIDNANADGLGALGNGLYRLFVYSGTLTGFEPNSTFAGPLGRSYTYTSTAATNGAIDLRISTLGLSWTGQDNGNGEINSTWNDTMATKNWANGTTATNFANGVSVTFQDTNAVTGAAITNANVQIKAGGVMPESVVFDNSSVNYVLTSADAAGIAGFASIVKNGTGTVSLNGANSYTGPTTINAGVVRLGHAAALGNTSGVNLGTLAVLDVNGQSASAGALTGSGTITNNSATAGALTLGNGDGDGVFTGVLKDGTGTLALVKTGAGRQILHAANTYSGGTTINGGILALGADYGQSDEASLGSGPIVVTGGGQLRFGGVGGALHEFTYDNAVTLNDGTIFANDSLQHLTGSLTVGAGGGRLGAQWTTKNLSIEGPIHGSGALTIFQEPANGGRVIFGVDNSATYSGEITIDAGGILQTQATGALGTGAITVNGTLDLNGNSQAIPTLTGAGAIALGTANLTVENGGFFGGMTGTGSLTKIGSSTFVLEGQNAFTGNTTVSEGVLEVTEFGKLYNVEYTAAPAVVVQEGATLRLAGWQFGENGSLGGLDFSPNKLLVDGGTIEYTGLGNDPSNSGRNFAIGAGGATLKASGTGLWTISADARGDYGTVTNDATLILDGAGTGRLEKPIAGSGSVTKNGLGTWTLSGQSSYMGETAIRAGTLVIAGSINGTSGVTVGNGGTLSGSGTIITSNDGSVTVASGGKIAPGDTLGTLSLSLGTGVLDISAAVATQPGALVFELDLPDGSDRIALTSGTLNIGTALLGFHDFVFLAQPDFAPGTYTLFDTDNAITGTLAADRTGFINGLPATLAFADDQQDIILTVIPEPGAAGTLMTSIGLLLGLQRFRCRTRRDRAA